MLRDTLDSDPTQRSCCIRCRAREKCCLLQNQETRPFPAWFHARHTQAQPSREQTTMFLSFFVTPVKFTFEIDGVIYSRTQIPLRLAWAVTVRKSQELTLGKVYLGLGGREYATSLTFVALSRVDDILLMEK